MCGMISIRTATQEDAISIARVHVESWRTTYRGIVPDAYLDGLNAGERTVRWREILSPSERIFVAEEDGEVVGFIYGGPIREPVGDCDAELYAIYLLLQAQSKGIGTALLIELARRLDGDGFRSMAVWVIEANSAAGFYLGSGAARVTQKQMSVGGAMLDVAAYAWPSLKSMITQG
jgi:L-amino acid N-acyltransferase YncA